LAAFYALKPKHSIATSTTPEIVRIVKPAAVTRAVSVKHWRSKLTQKQRAERAAKWLNGELLVLPTIGIAGIAFGATYPAIVKARGKLGRLGVLARAWTNCDEEQRATFAAAFEPGLWHALEHVADQHN
jgi:hypothetical protein